MTDIIYTKQTINWEQKVRCKNEHNAPVKWKTVNKKKGRNFGHYVKDPVVKYGVIQHCVRCQDYEYDFAS